MGFKVINEGEPITWIDFEKQIQIDIAEYKLQKKNKKKTGYHSPWIFRGQANAEWKLETSLERFLRDELGHTDNYYNAQKYYTYLSSIVPAINSLTEKCFERFTPHEIKFKKIGTVPQYELLCFARHHGFPTPILDWSHSYYVAAFFAFAQAKADQDCL